MSDRLYRSRDDRVLTGVAGGLAEALDADPSVIRVVWALLVFLTGGIALVAYVVMAIVVPERPEGSPSTGRPGPAPGGRGRWGRRVGPARPMDGPFHPRRRRSTTVVATRRIGGGAAWSWGSSSSSSAGSSSFVSSCPSSISPSGGR